MWLPSYGAGTPKRQRYSAVEIGEKIKQDFMDCGVITKDVKLCINFSRAQVVEEFKAMKKEARSLKKKDGIDLGFFIFGIGYMIREYFGHNRDESEFQNEFLKT